MGIALLKGKETYDLANGLKLYCIAVIYYLTGTEHINTGRKSYFKEANFGRNKKYFLLVALNF